MRYEPPPDRGLKVCYRDAQLLVVDKPAGLLTVPGRGVDKQDCLWARVRRDFPEALVVHRLDMGTSGLVLFALDREIQGRLGRMFQERHIGKRYVAVVAGRPDAQEGKVALPLITDWPRRPRQKVDLRLGRPASTRWRILAPEPTREATRVELVPLTGRSHQLRVHMLALGHPILGDELYGDSRTRQAADRLLLHAQVLSFVHPVNGEAVYVESTVPF